MTNPCALCDRDAKTWCNDCRRAICEFCLRRTIKHGAQCVECYNKGPGQPHNPGRLDTKE